MSETEGIGNYPNQETGCIERPEEAEKREIHEAADVWFISDNGRGSRARLHLPDPEESGEELVTRCDHFGGFGTAGWRSVAAEVFPFGYREICLLCIHHRRGNRRESV